MDPIFIWIEQTPYSIWVREEVSVFAFPLMLILHAVGMGLLAGLHIAICMRVLGFAPGVPMPALRSYFPFLWFGLAVNVFSGISLLIAYPTKALTNPLFYIKLGLIAGALVGLRWMRRNIFGIGLAPSFGGELPASAHRVAALSIFCWVSAIFAGRWLAYTYSRLMAS
jgi:hypothetical protein